MHQAYILLGSNIEPARNLPEAVALLRDQVVIEAASHVWETPPEGTHGANFLNAAILARTPLSPGLLKSLVLRPIEARMGRIRTFNKYAPRTIDLDIIIFDQRTLDPKLWTQAFVAVPLAELAPEVVHPDTGKSLAEIAQDLARNILLKLRPDVVLRPPAPDR
jgi:2-amino-4-hydroxy-6-hydroxymethyldihydropteridine diphosphokinase